MLRSFANRVHSLMLRPVASTASDETEPSAVGFVERLRDEWNARNDLLARPERFGLRQLLATRAAGGPATLDAPAFMRDERAGPLPTERLDADGNPQPLDDAFFARERYRLSELTGFADVVFIEVAFRCVLKRRPDPAGFAAFLRGIRSGSLDRIDVVRGLSASGEGRRAGVVIDGLARVAFWRRAGRAPVVGTWIRWALALLRLPRLVQEQRAFQAQTLAWQQRQARHDETIRIELERLKIAIVTLQDTDDEIGAAVVDLANRVQRTRAEMSLEGTRTTSATSSGARPDDVARSDRHHRTDPGPSAGATNEPTR